MPVDYLQNLKSSELELKGKFEQWLSKHSFKQLRRNTTVADTIFSGREFQNFTIMAGLPGTFALSADLQKDVYTPTEMKRNILFERGVVYRIILAGPKIVFSDHPSNK